MSAKNNPFKEQEKNRSLSGKVFKYFGAALVTLAIIGLIFVSFSSGRGRNQASFVFGRYGNRNIEFRPDNAFGQAVENEISRTNNQLQQKGNETSNEMIQFFRLMAWQQAFRKVVVNEAIAYELDDSGYKISPRAVDRYIVKFGPFRTNGEFDEELYLNASSSRKAAVRTQMREQLTLTTWAEDVLNSRYYSAGELDFLEDMRRSVKSYEYVTIPFTDFPEKDVIAYAEKNPQLFRRLPLSRITIEAGNKRSSSEAEEKANEVFQLYQEQKDNMDAFSNLAMKNSDDSFAQDGGSMGATEYYRLSELIGSENADAVFAAKKGEVTGPFDTDYGWMIFRTEGAIANPAAEDIKDQVRGYMLQNEAGLIEDTLIARAKELSLQARSRGNFRSAAEEAGLTVSSTNEFAFNFGNDSLLGSGPETNGDASLSGSSSSETFWEALLTMNKIGDISEPVVLNSAVGLFSLVSESEQEPLQYWEDLVKYEMSRSRENDFRSAVLSSENPLFENDFSEAYNRFFPSNQG
ncbi:MAG: hypothetical protein CSA76_01110 [Spirochaetales bacterium]|nr:MAG: hypothetical protein CSA76_01110 [Spirochaetales bacterium]